MCKAIHVMVTSFFSEIGRMYGEATVLTDDGSATNDTICVQYCDGAEIMFNPEEDQLVEMTMYDTPGVRPPIPHQGCKLVVKNNGRRSLRWFHADKYHQALEERVKQSSHAKHSR